MATTTTRRAAAKVTAPVVVETTKTVKAAKTAPVISTVKTSKAAPVVAVKNPGRATRTAVKPEATPASATAKAAPAKAVVKTAPAPVKPVAPVVKTTVAKATAKPNPVGRPATAGPRTKTARTLATYKCRKSGLEFNMLTVVSDLDPLRYLNEEVPLVAQWRDYTNGMVKVVESFLKDVAKLLPGVWSVKSELAAKSLQCGFYLVRKDGLTLTFHRHDLESAEATNRAQVVISMRVAQEHKPYVGDALRSLSTPKRSVKVPSYLMAVTKGADSVAAAIQRNILPYAQKIYAALLERVRLQAEADKAADELLARIVKVTGASVRESNADRHTTREGVKTTATLIRFEGGQPLAHLLEGCIVGRGGKPVACQMRVVVDADTAAEILTLLKKRASRKAK